MCTPCEQTCWISALRAQSCARRVSDRKLKMMLIWGERGAAHLSSSSRLFSLGIFIFFLFRVSNILHDQVMTEKLVFLACFVCHHVTENFWNFSCSFRRTIGRYVSDSLRLKCLGGPFQFKALHRHIFLFHSKKSRWTDDLDDAINFVNFQVTFFSSECAEMNAECWHERYKSDILPSFYIFSYYKASNETMSVRRPNNRRRCIAHVLHFFLHILVLLARANWIRVIVSCLTTTRNVKFSIRIRFFLLVSAMFDIILFN